MQHHKIENNIIFNLINIYIYVYILSTLKQKPFIINR